MSSGHLILSILVVEADGFWQFGFAYTEPKADDFLQLTPAAAEGD